jgi:hypothetical protein
VRRSRAEQLILVGDDGVPVVLAAEMRHPGEVATQDVFQVSADGAYLAYAFAGKLHVRAADAVERTIADYREGSQMRFSPDGTRLAAVVGAEHAHVVVMDLATGDVHDAATLETSIRQVEWTRDRLVALAGSALVAVPLDGPPATLMVDYGIEKVAAGGDRVVVFDRQDDGTHVLALGIDAPRDLRELRTVADSVTNAALTLDGERLAFTTPLAVFESAGDAPPAVISERAGVHSLWFSRDGRLGYASAASATVLDGAHPQRFDSDGTIAMLRFDRRSNEMLVATQTHAWGAGKRLASPPPGQSLLGVDRFAGGVVLWTSRQE